MTSDERCFLDAIAHEPEVDAHKLVYADWLQENGGTVLPHVIRQQVAFGLPFATTAVRDIGLADLRSDYDWREVFGQGGGGNCHQKADACPPGSAVDITPPNIEDVVGVVAASNGENDGAEWVGLFEMRDGRYVVASGGCDFTGWDCQANNSIEVAASAADAVCVGLSKEQIVRLWGVGADKPDEIELPAPVCSKQPKRSCSCLDCLSA